jgi:hypothetical protein
MARMLTLRGVVSTGIARERVFFFDSNVTSTGWKILGFQILPNDISQGYTTAAVLHTGKQNITFADWDPNTTVGLNITSKENNNQTMIDFNHVVVGDLYLTNLTLNQPVSYLIVLEEIKITPSENIIYRIKEQSQNVDSP